MIYDPLHHTLSYYVILALLARSSPHDIFPCMPSRYYTCQGGTLDMRENRNASSRVGREKGDSKVKSCRITTMRIWFISYCEYDRYCT